MTQKEIIGFEETNTGVIRLYLEGTFYKAYERSAFAFCTRIKDYRVLRKESKTLGRDILYVGFPMAALDKTLGDAMTRKVSDTVLDVVLSYPMNENEFLQWRDSQEVEQASRALLSPYTKVIEKSPVYKTAYDILTRHTHLQEYFQELSDSFRRKDEGTVLQRMLYRQRTLPISFRETGPQQGKSRSN